MRQWKANQGDLNADIPLSVDHWRYFAAVIRAEEGSATELDANTVSMNIKAPLGVVAQFIPWNFPLLMLSWKLPSALAEVDMYLDDSDVLLGQLEGVNYYMNQDQFEYWKHTHLTVDVTRVEVQVFPSKSLWVYDL